MTIDSVLDEQLELMRQGDSAALAARYSEDGQMIHSGGVANGRAEIEAEFASQAALHPAVESLSEAGRGEDCVNYRGVMAVSGERIGVAGTFVLRDGEIWRHTTIITSVE